MKSEIIPSNEDILKLKPQFDLLTYPEKLLFWDKHNWTKSRMNFPDEFPSGRMLKYWVSIEPKTESEKHQYENWKHSNLELKIGQQEERNTILSKLKWNGTQKNLAELILELQNKGWILEIQPNDLKEQVNTICSLFDITETQKKKDSNPIQSLYQILKGEKIDDKREYRKIYSDRYKKNFDTIKKCAK